MAKHNEIAKLVFGLLALVGVTLLLPACSSDPSGGADDSNAVDVAITSDQFTPASVTIKVGQTVRWTWRGGTHNVVSGATCGTPDGQFKSREPQAGGTYEHIFATAGTFKYYCELHCTQQMTGEVVVQ